jgi:hypothetical protein
MKPVAEWTEEDVLSLPHGEFDWLEAKGRRALDLTLPTVREADVLENLAKEICAFANSGGGQLILGLANPTSGTSNWNVDDGGISTSIKGKISTKEWLEDVIPNLLEFPLTEFNVYPITPKGSNSQIISDRALYVVDIADSSNAPHQSARDKRYYARVAGKSQPISHRMVVDIMSRRQHPKIELEFSIERKFIKGKPRQLGDFSSYALLGGDLPPEKDTNTYELIIRARNTGKVYAQYVNAFIYIPVQLLPTRDVKVWGIGRIEKIDGKDFLRYYEENTRRDVVGFSGTQRQYGPARYDPILPRLAHVWEITLQHDNENLKKEDLLIKWEVHVDNAPPNSGEIKIADVKVVSAVEPNFDSLSENEG